MDCVVGGLIEKWIVLLVDCVVGDLLEKWIVLLVI